MKNLQFKIYIIIFLLINSNGYTSISLEEVLKKPNDLKLNLQYIKEQEDLGNYNSVITTLDRMINLFPENIELKMYYLFISLKINSVERTFQIIDEIKKNKQLTSTILNEVDIVLDYLNNLQTPKITNISIIDVDLSLNQKQIETNRRAEAEIISIYSDYPSQRSLVSNLNLDIDLSLNQKQIETNRRAEAEIISVYSDNIEIVQKKDKLSDNLFSSNHDGLISLQEVLRKPNDLKLNLQYTKEQEDLGNYKSVIATLERLTSLYPENIDLKMYYLSVSLRIDSVERTIQIIDEIKKSKQLTSAINEEVDKILVELNNSQELDKDNKWKRYIDVSLTAKHNTNINNISNSNTFYVSDSLSNYASNEVKKDDLEIPSIRIGAYKRLNNNSSLNFNVGLADTYQAKDKSEEKDLSSLFINYNNFNDNNAFSSAISYNKSNYRNQADIYSYNLNLNNKLRLNSDNFLLTGINSNFTKYDNNATFSTTRQKNNYSYGGSIGYEMNYLNNKLTFNYSANEVEALADQYGYDQEIFLYNLSRKMKFGTAALSKSFTHNEYAKADTFVLSNTIRNDELENTSISLRGELSQIYFFNKFKILSDAYYNLIMSKIESESNILNYDYVKEIYSIGLTKRVNFWKKYY